jgi:hypothetical protein
VQRLSLTSKGLVLVKFKKPWRDGSTHCVLEPLTLLERLAALIPAPVVKLITYHGVFAPAFPLRDTVVPPPPAQDDECRGHHFATNSDTTSPPPPAAQASTPTKQRPKPRPRYAWAELLRRVYLVDVLCCPNCSARRRLLAFITDRHSIRAILAHLGLPTELPAIAPARAPPRPALPLP